jgi:hypothetical protein
VVKVEENFFKFHFSFGEKNYIIIFAPQIKGAIAQLVEQRTENPCVPSSILGGTTKG